ncbi:unnamed protein product, partial [Phaeothamnion confervicola]
GGDDGGEGPARKQRRKAENVAIDAERRQIILGLLQQERAFLRSALLERVRQVAASRAGGSSSGGDGGSGSSDASPAVNAEEAISDNALLRLLEVMMSEGEAVTCKVSLGTGRHNQATVVAASAGEIGMHLPRLLQKVHQQPQRRPAGSARRSGGGSGRGGNSGSANGGTGGGGGDGSSSSNGRSGGGAVGGGSDTEAGGGKGDGMNNGGSGGDGGRAGRKARTKVSAEDSTGNAGAGKGDCAEAGSKSSRAAEGSIPEGGGSSSAAGGNNTAGGGSTVGVSTTAGSGSSGLAGSGPIAARFEGGKGIAGKGKPLERSESLRGHVPGFPPDLREATVLRAKVLHLFLWRFVYGGCNRPRGGDDSKGSDDEEGAQTRKSGGGGGGGGGAGASSAISASAASTPAAVVEAGAAVKTELVEQAASANVAPSQASSQGAVFALEAALLALPLSLFFQLFGPPDDPAKKFYWLDAARREAADGRSVASASAPVLRGLAHGWFSDGLLRTLDILRHLDLVVPAAGDPNAAGAAAAGIVTAAAPAAPAKAATVGRGAPAAAAAN